LKGIKCGRKEEKKDYPGRMFVEKEKKLKEAEHKPSNREPCKRARAVHGKSLTKKDWEKITKKGAGSGDET